MALSSPGVQVSVIDESFYTPAEPGTVPLVIVATAENKANSAGTGTAPGTIQAAAGTVYLLTSQRDLVDTFGDPVFKTDANNNPIHAGEQNEFGLQAAYSLLGVSNRAYVVRADVDLDQLTASATEPTAYPTGGTHWLDTANTKFGIFEWNNAAITTTGGQKFTNKIPLVITDSTQLVTATDTPKNNVGSIGDYAIVVTDNSTTTPALTTAHPNKVWYKSRGVAPGQTLGQWVEVGSSAWFESWPVVTSNAVNTVAVGTIIINGTSIVSSATTVSTLANAINLAAITGISASAVNSKLEIYFDGTSGTSAEDSSQSNLVTISGAPLVGIGIAAGNYYAPKVQISKHTQVPEWKATNTYPRPTGSVWVKTTDPNAGARWSVQRWNSTTLLWETVTAPLYAHGHEAIYNLDASGGGVNLATGTLYVKTNYNEDDGTDNTPRNANFAIFRRVSTGSTSIRTAAVTGSTFSVGVKQFSISESLLGVSTLSYRTMSVTTQGTSADADLIASAINGIGFTNIEASVDTSNRVTISHKLGGDFRLQDGTGSPLSLLGLSPYVFEPSSATYATGTANLSAAPTGDSTHDYVASLWHPLVYVADSSAPGSLTEDGTLWYNSVIDEVDMLIHDGTTWVGYLTQDSPYYNVSAAEKTDPEGPLVSATEPETQSDNSPLKTGDLWIDTSDLENFPTIYKYNSVLPAGQRWVLVDKTDQSTEEGILFADARYNTQGINSNDAGLITDLLSSYYLDTDAPDPALYPKGMLLWNLRRSGFNVKRFVRNYVSLTDSNTRFKVDGLGDYDSTGVAQSQAAYYEHRWVTESPNQADGSGTFGRKSQRAVVVKALQALVNNNEQIRDEESRVFNLIACPGYSELIGEMVSLNTDRGLTAFVVGDTPARLTSDATSLLNWASNANGALEDNEIGAATYDEYMAMFYPWGFTSDNFGNNVAVPPSHMMLRTIALNDQVAYPWFAPAGVRRGGISNATAVGYVTSEGEFSSVALNTGQRDTLYEQKINPLTFFTGTGLVNYGQKTRARAASSLDRINVARLVVYLRRQLNQLAKPYIFEPNDKITRDEIKASVESLMLELVGQRAIYDYIVVCDESNNTPSRIDRNELYIDIAIEPVKAVEFIYIPLRLKNTGEIASLG